MDKQKTKRLLYIVYSGKKNPAKMSELREINAFMEDFDENIEVLWGHYQDDELEDEIKVAIVATGFDQADTSTGNEEMSDEKRLLQSLREKYYAMVPRVVQEKDKEGNEHPMDGVTLEETPESEVLSDEEDGVDVSEDNEENEGDFQSKRGSFWSAVKEKLNRWVEEV